MDTSQPLPDVKLLRLFDQLHATGSVTRTAEVLGLAQPTVSIGLAKLRVQWNDPLFVRTPQGMLPTPRANALVATVREVLSGLQQLASQAVGFDPATSQRQFRICMTDASHITLLPLLLAHVRAHAPGVRLEAARIDGGLTHALQAGEADLAIGYLPWLEAGFFQQTLYAQDWICLANARHPRIRPDGAGWSLAAYADEAHIAISSGTGQQLLDGALQALRMDRNVRLALPGFLGLATILQTTDLVATLPRHIGETLARNAGLLALPCPFEIPGFKVKQHWHARFHHDAANQWLRGVCVNLFGVSPPAPTATPSA